MALSQHPARLILIFTKKRKGPHGRVSRVCNARPPCRESMNEMRKEKNLLRYYTLVLIKHNSTITQDRECIFLIPMSAL